MTIMDKAKKLMTAFGNNSKYGRVVSATETKEINGYIKIEFKTEKLKKNYLSFLVPRGHQFDTKSKE